MAGLVPAIHVFGDERKTSASGARSAGQARGLRVRFANACFIVPSFAGLVAIARSLYPIPSRTRPSKSSAPMVLNLKVWKSRSLPGLPRTEQRIIPKKPVLGLDPRMVFRLSDQMMRNKNISSSRLLCKKPRSSPRGFLLFRELALLPVMPALVAGIHVLTAETQQRRPRRSKDVDGRNKSGHDGASKSSAPMVLGLEEVVAARPAKDGALYSSSHSLSKSLAARACAARDNSATDIVLA